MIYPYIDTCYPYIDNCYPYIVIRFIQILSLMVGSNKSSEQLTAIADRTILEADEDKDGFICYEEFKKVQCFFQHRNFVVLSYAIFMFNPYIPMS